MRNCGLSLPKEIAPEDDMPHIVREERNHQMNHLLEEVQQAVQNWNGEKNDVYKNVFWSVENNLGKIYCILPVAALERPN